MAAKATEKKVTRKKVSEKRQALVNRAETAGVSEKIDWTWPEAAIEALVSQAEAAKEAKTSAAKKTSAKRTAREAFEARAVGELAKTYQRFILDPAWTSKLDRKEAGGTEKTAAQHGAKFLSVLYVNGLLSETFTQYINDTFPNE